MVGLSSIPYWRLSGFYFFYFALVGALSPYLSLYLSDIGLTAYAIGLVNAVLMGTKIVAPNLWGWICDRTGKRLLIIGVGLGLATLFFAGLFFWQALLPILIITFLYSFFWNAVLSQFDTLTIQYLDENSQHYSRVRVWGSVGFIASVTALGFLFDVVSIAYLIPISWVLLFLITINCTLLSEPPARKVSHVSISCKAIIKQPAVIAFFMAAFLLQLSFGAYYTFFSLYLESYGYTRTTIGLLWALGVIAEVILFLIIHRLMPAMGVSYLLFWSLLLTSMRWFLTAFFADVVWVMLLAQCIHAFSFGAAHAASIELIRQFFKGKNAGQGNALYSSVTFGAGGAIGALLSGYLWGINPQLLFVMAGVVLLLAAAIARLGLCGNALVRFRENTERSSGGKNNVE
ncbi:MAG: PPP family 3-phenylpropionic acid transporter [Candidatus Endobugula sp.]|jgi:PPP family 3-phenylpropionic acid transporter